tara:strand:+ start:4332 stop:4505 length:174 start_codon:yes stop_codon:yes gene_type:complete
MSSNIENWQIQIDSNENDLRTIKKDEWEICCKYIASFSIIIIFIFLVIFVYNNAKNF